MPASVGIAIITHTAVKLLPRNLPPLLASPIKPRILVVNSSSNDGTVELAQAMGAETLVVPRRDFNHGATREAARKALGTDIVVMITPDAIASGPQMVERLIKPILDDATVGISYARQIPHDGADFFESFPRDFNYASVSHVRSAADLPRFGNMTFFCSDSCAAWSNRALDDVGGFQATLTAEDAIAAAKMIRAGYKVAYAADAIVKHSHRYNLRQEFQRYFDTGLNRRRNADLLLKHEADEAYGARFASAMLGQLWRTRPQRIPYALLLVAAKLLGYRIGYHSLDAPRWLKRRLSSQDFYWESSHAI